jgi:hypothetical protein
MIVDRPARTLVVVALLAVAACQPTPPPTPTVPPARPAAVAPSSVHPSPSVALPAMDLPPGPIYACDVAGTRAPIVYSDNVETLCRRHPEMGVCQYERDQCRARGGRVYTAKGDEVSLAVEAEYDKRVHRVRFQADGSPAKR